MQSIKLFTIYHSKKINSHSGGVENLIHDLLKRLTNVKCRVRFSYTLVDNIKSLKKNGMNCIVGSYSTYILIISILVYIFSFKSKLILWVPCFHPFDDQYRGRTKLLKNIKFFYFTKIILKILIPRCKKIFIFTEREFMTLSNLGVPDDLMKIVSLNHKFENMEFSLRPRKFEVGFYGRWAQSKGSDLVLQLSERGLINWVSSIDIPQNECEYLKQNNVSVDFFRNDSELWERLLDTRIIIIPSLSESYGYAGIESRAAGCNVVYYDCPSIERDNTGSYKVMTYDIYGWLEAIERAAKSNENIPATKNNVEEYLYLLIQKELSCA